MEKDNSFKITLNSEGQMMGGGFTIPSTDAEQIRLKPTFDVVDGQLVQLEPEDVQHRQDFRDGKLNGGSPRFKARNKGE